MPSALGTVLSVIALGVFFAQGYLMALELRYQNQVEARFNHTDETLEDLEIAILGLQIEVINLTQDLKHTMEKKR